MSEKSAMLITEKEKKLIEYFRGVKFAKEVPVTVVNGEPTEIGEHKEVKKL
jgi:hypothetical protein